MNEDTFFIKLSLNDLSEVNYTLGKVQIASAIMNEVIASVQRVCQVEQDKMNTLIERICKENGHTLPAPYEFKLDQGTMTLVVRKKEGAVSN